MTSGRSSRASGNAARSSHGPSGPDHALIPGAQDADPRFIDEALDVLIGPAEQITFDNERTAADRLGATLPEVDATHRLVACFGLTFAARPALRAVARPGLYPEQKRLLPDIKTRLRIGLDLQTGNMAGIVDRSEEHTSELQSPCNLVCRLLLEKKKQR